MEKVKWGREVTPPEYEVGVIVQSLHVVGLFDDSLDGWMRENGGGSWLDCRCQEEERVH